MDAYPQITRSLVSPEAVRALAAANWDIAPNCGLLLHRGFNDSYRLDAGASAWVLRLYRAQRWTDAAIAEELDLLDELGREGVRVARAIHTREGAWTISVPCPEGPRLAALFEYIPGGFGFPVTAKRCGEEGRLLGEIHRVLVRGRFQHRRTIGRETLLEQPLRDLMEAFPQHADKLEELGQRLRFDDGEDGPLQRIHGDYIFINLVGQPSPVAIDFDFAGNGPTAYDFASYRWGISAHLKGDEFARAWDSFRAGYSEIIPHLPADDRLRRWELWRELWVWAIHTRDGTDFRRLSEPSFGHHMGKFRAVD